MSPHHIPSSSIVARTKVPARQKHPIGRFKTRQSVRAFPTRDEYTVIETLGPKYLSELDDPGMLDIALSDLGAIKEMRPDLKDRDLAYLVRTADFDEDAEAWMFRVQNHVAHSIDP
jgi:hypothetical protein